MRSLRFPEMSRDIEGAALLGRLPLNFETSVPWAHPSRLASYRSTDQSTDPAAATNAPPTDRPDHSRR